MEKRSLALQNVSEAIHLDENGCHRAAFDKYLQSLQTLSSYLNDLYKVHGFDKILERKKEVKHVLSVIHECSDRVTSIIDKKNEEQSRIKAFKELFVNGKIDPKKKNLKPTIEEQSQSKTSEKLFVSGNIEPKKENLRSTVGDSKFPAFEKMKNENMLLFRTYQLRIERAPDKYTKSNLRLELQRRMAENLALAKEKYALAIKEHHKEHLNNMDQTMKKLFENSKKLSEKELEKKELFIKVLHYSANETLHCPLRYSSIEQSANDIIQNVFQRTIKTNFYVMNILFPRQKLDIHPLCQWLRLKQVKIEKDIHSICTQCSQWINFLPNQNVSEMSKVNPVLTPKLSDASICLELENGESVSIPLLRLSCLQKDLELISYEISDTIENGLQIFCLTYRSILPDDSESACYKLMETAFLEPLWSSLIVLFRLSNLLNEHKVLQTMLENKTSLPTKFGFFINNDLQFTEIYQDVITKLRRLPDSSSLSEKLEILVQVSQKLCEGKHLKPVDSEKRYIGADDFIPLLCYIIVQSGSYQLVSECYALEQLFDHKYMLGEEGYALSSFLMALKYLEMKKLIDEGACQQPKQN